jgi:ribosomal protein L37AE/L43A
MKKYYKEKGNEDKFKCEHRNGFVGFNEEGVWECRTCGNTFTGEQIFSKPKKNKDVYTGFEA